MRDIVKRDIVKRDIVKRDIVKRDIVKRDIVKRDIVKRDIVKRDIVKRDIVKRDIVKRDIVKRDIVKRDIVKRDIVKRDIVKRDIVKRDIVKRDIVKRDIVKRDIVKRDIVKRDIVKRDIAKCLVWAGLNLGLCRVAFAAAPDPSEAAPVDLGDIELEGRTIAPTPKAGPSWSGLLLLHAADGVGAGGQVRYENVGLRASVAYQPQYFVVDKDPWDDEFARFKFANSAQLNLDAFYLFGESEKGASLSYRYSTLLGHGLGVAYQSYIDLAGARFALSIPVVYYPAAARRVPSALGLKGDEEVNFPFGPGVEYGIGVAWLF